MEVSQLFFLLTGRIVMAYFFATGGKSAIMAAIIVGLGGKATTTSRSTSLQQFIRSGKRFITHTLNNNVTTLIYLVYCLCFIKCQSIMYTRIIKK